jgi:Tfp pilus assembly protein PilV
MKKFIFIGVLSLFLFQGHTLLFSQEKRERIGIVEETLVPEISVVNNILYVKNAPVGSRIQIITILGNKVVEIEVRSSTVSYELNLPKAIYIFKLQGLVRKFVIK